VVRGALGEDHNQASRLYPLIYQSSGAKPHTTFWGERAIARVHYIIAAWCGLRSASLWDADFREDHCYYTRMHLAQLGRVRHNLDQITVVVPESSHTPYDLEEIDYLVSLDVAPKNVVVLRAPTFKVSYCSWLFAHRTFEYQFDYEILIEDDYVPMIDNFDEI
jgi:hypothetical protein